MAAEDGAVMPVVSSDMSDEYAFEDKEGVEQDLSGDGGCVKTILRKGSGWEKPEKGDEVTVHYVGTLLDGTQFDSSRDRGDEFVFKLGEGRVIKGWDTGVATMKQGELSRLTCRADYAYGAAGSPPTIPPDATLQFEVELLSWKSVKDITGDGGVIKTITQEGKGWQHPRDDDEVVLTYTAHIIDPPAGPTPSRAAAAAAAAGGAAGAGGADQPPAALGAAVASSPEGGAVFSVGQAPCSGLAAAVKSMKEQETVTLLLKPEYAAGLVDTVPEGKVVRVNATLTAVHTVTHPAPGVSKKTITKSENNYMRPNPGSTVTVTVEVRGLGDADTAVVYEPSREVELVLDEEQAPDAVELSLTSMSDGERAIITVTDPTLLAAPQGALVGAGIPAGTAAAVFDVTLLSFKRAKEKWEMNNQEKLDAAVLCKEKGNAAYKAGNVARAVRQYTAAFEAANSISERDMAPNADTSAEATAKFAKIFAHARDVKKAAHLNLSAAALKQQNWPEAIKQASKVLELDPGNVKALYRRAQGHLSLSDLLEAELDIRQGLLSHPDNTDLAALQRKLKVQMREVNKKEAKLYGKMFAALGAGGHLHSKIGSNSDQGAAAGTAAPGVDVVAPTTAAADDSEDTATSAGTAVVEAAA